MGVDKSVDKHQGDVVGRKTVRKEKKEERAEYRLTISFSPTQYRALQAASRLLGGTLSGVVRQAVDSQLGLMAARAARIRAWLPGTVEAYEEGDEDEIPF